MAEAAVESSAGRFFCHKCTTEINHVVLPDYVCPRCQSGFIEELRQQSSTRPNDLLDDETGNGNQTNLSFLSFLDGVGHDGGQSSAQHGQIPHPRMTVRTSSLDRNLIAPWEGIVQQIVSNLTGGAAFPGNHGFPVFLNLHGNLGDYAWGRGGFDAIITQLLNQLDCTGPPPLAKDKINKIPKAVITQEQVDKILQCTVCMEDFKLHEQVSKLPCLHHFHKDCIVPWLELHGTCPICRKLISEDINDGTTSVPSSSSSSTSSSSSNISSSSSGSTSATSNSHTSSSVYDFIDDFD